MCHQGGKVPNRLFYLSIPPNIFVDVVRSASRTASSSTGWTRFIVEKPFGRDSESSGELTRSLKKYLAEEQIFRHVDTMHKTHCDTLDLEMNIDMWMHPAGLTIIWARSWSRTCPSSASPTSSLSRCGRGTTSGTCSSSSLKISAPRVEAGLQCILPFPYFK